MSGVFFLSFFFLATSTVSTVAITIAIVNQRLDTPLEGLLSVASYDINVKRANARSLLR